MKAEEFREEITGIGVLFIAESKATAAKLKERIADITKRLDASDIDEIYVKAIMNEFAEQMAEGAKEIEAELDD